MKFTIQGNLADLKVKEQLGIVCKELKSQIPNIKSIILAGSFGYGEGPIKEKNGKYYPFNDFDIYVITDEKISKKKTDEIATSAAKKLGFKGIEYFYNFKKEDQKLEDNFYVDLKIMTENELKKVLPRLRFYKFEDYTYILEGNDVRPLVPSFKLKQIPLSEPAKLLLDRMSQMVEYYSIKENYDKDILTYFIQQAYASISTALTMLSRTYKPSYKKSMEGLVEIYENQFPELSRKLPNLHLRIKKYIDWKLNPQGLPQEDIKEAWLTCANDLIEVSKYFFSVYLKKDIQTLDQLSKAILKMPPKFYAPYIGYKFKIKRLEKLIKFLFFIPAFYLKHKYYQRLKQMNIKHKKIFLNKYSPDAYIFASVPYLLTAISLEGIDLSKLQKAKKILKKVYPVKSDNWEDLSLEYAKAYIAFFMQKLG